MGCVCDVMVKGQLLTKKYRRVSSGGARDKMQKKVVCVYVCVCGLCVCVCVVKRQLLTNKYRQVYVCCVFVCIKPQSDH